MVVVGPRRHVDRFVDGAGPRVGDRIAPVRLCNQTLRRKPNELGNYESGMGLRCP